MVRVDFTDYEAALIFVTAAVRYGIEYAPSDRLVKERPECPWLEAVITRHGPDSVEAKWYDFRSGILPGHARKRGVSKQVEQVVHDLGWMLER
jgi:hypothetical protein